MDWGVIFAEEIKDGLWIITLRDEYGEEYCVYYRPFANERFAT